MPSSERITRIRAAYPAQLAIKSARFRGPAGDGWNHARTCERLPNGMWRVDYVGGLVEMFDAMPEADTRGVQS